MVLPLQANPDSGEPMQLAMQALARGDYAQAYCVWRPLAEDGLAEAQYHVGWLYANGNGLAVDLHKALAWWKRAASQGHADAQFAVGLAYTTGEGGIRRNLDEAVHWYLVAARQGHPDARDILVRLNGDPTVRLLERYPDLVNERWFGRPGRILGNRINVRSGPGVDYAIMHQLDDGAPVRIVGERGEWLWILLPDGDAAWVHRTLIEG
jgi:hypothetical protein